MSFTAIAQSTNDPPRVLLTIDGLGSTTTSLTILRIDPDGRQRPVRGAEPATPTVGGWTGYDYEAPLGVPLTYLAYPVPGAWNQMTENQMSLETDLEGWAANDANTTVTRSTAQAAVGLASLAMTAVGAGTVQATTPTGYNGAVVTAGVSYTALARFRAATTARAVSMSITWYDAAGNGVAGTINGSPVNDTSTGWTQFTVTGTAPAGTVYARVVLSAYSLAAGETHYVDDIALYVTNGITQTTAPANLLTDSDYETGMPAWVTGYGGVTPAMVAPGKDSAAAVGITVTSTSAAQGVIHTAPLGTSVASGASVRCGAWVKATAGETIRITGRAVQVSGSTQYTENGGATDYVATGGWQWITTADWAWSSNDYRPGVIVRMRDGGGYTLGTTIVVDQASIYLVSSLTPVQLNVSDVWLVHPGVPDLSVAIPVSQVTKVEPRQRGARSAVHQPLGRSTPVVVSEVRGAVTSGLNVYTATANERTALWDALEDGSALLLNIPPSLGWGTTSEWVAVGDVTETPIVGNDPARTLTMPYAVVDRPAGAVAVTWTWAGVLGAYGTWSAISAAYDTEAELLANAPD